MSDDIDRPKPIFNDSKINDKRRKQEVLSIGSKRSGITIIVTNNGLTINGHYEGNGRDFKTGERRIHANLIDWYDLPWEEIDKIRAELTNKGTEKGKQSVKKKKKKAK